MHIARKEASLKMDDMSIKQLQDELNNLRPEEWSRIPDIGLYMDQVISYMQGQHIGFEVGSDESITSAMINNYIKSGLLPRANGKKYDRDHIVYLTVICLLKQVLSVRETGELLGTILNDAEAGGRDTEELYGKYTEMADREYRLTADKLSSVKTESDAAELALKLAVSSYAQKLACEQLVSMLAADSKQDGKGKKK